MIKVIPSLKFSSYNIIYNLILLFQNITSRACDIEKQGGEATPLQLIEW